MCHVLSFAWHIWGWRRESLYLVVSSTILQFPVRAPPLPSLRWISCVMLHVQVRHVNQAWLAFCVGRGEQCTSRLFKAKSEIKVDLVENSALRYFYRQIRSTCVPLAHPGVVLWWFSARYCNLSCKFIPQNFYRTYYHCKALHFGRVGLVFLQTWTQWQPNKSSNACLFGENIALKYW